MIPVKKFVDSEVHSEVESNSQNLNTFQIALLKRNRKNENESYNGDSDASYQNKNSLKILEDQMPHPRGSFNQE
jgi:hypothetical protein